MSTDKQLQLGDVTSTDSTDGKSADVDALMDAFDCVETWETSVTITGNGERVAGLVGRQVDVRRKAYRIYSHPRSSTSGFLGVLARNSEFDDNDACLEFFPAVSSSDDEKKDDSNGVSFDVENGFVVSELTVTEHTRTIELDAVLPLIRERITDETWIRFDVDIDNVDLSSRKYLIDEETIDSVGFDTDVWVPVDPDAGWEAWQDAAMSLKEFFHNQYEEENVALSVDSISEPKVKHELARYPHDATHVIDIPASEIRENGNNPEAFRSLLIDYAKYWTCLIGVTVPITYGVVNTDTINPEKNKTCCNEE